MGYYYNPPRELPNVARKLQPANYAGLVAQLKPGEQLFALYQRLDAPFSNAPHLFSEDEMSAFSSQVVAGRLRFDGYFALPAELSGSPFPTQVAMSAGLKGQSTAGRR